MNEKGQLITQSIHKLYHYFYCCAAILLKDVQIFIYKAVGQISFIPMSRKLTPSTTITCEVADRPTQAFQNRVPIPNFITKMLVMENDPTTIERAKQKRIMTKFYKGIRNKLEKEPNLPRKQELQQRLSSVISLKSYADPNDKQILQTVFLEEWKKAHVNERGGKTNTNRTLKQNHMCLSTSNNCPNASLRAIVEDLPLQMAFRVTDIPHSMLNNMMTHYGNPKYVKMFGEKSESISMSGYDSATLKGYHGTTNTPRKSSLSYMSKELYEAVGACLREEEPLMAKGITNLEPLEIVADWEDMIKKGAQLQKEDCKRLTGIPLKTIQVVCACEGESNSIFSCWYDIQPWWSFEHRTRYLMDFWSAFPDNSTESKKLQGANTELQKVIQKNGSTLDSTYLSFEGSVTQSALQTFLKEALQKVLGSQNEEDNCNVNEVIFGTGILKTGKSAGHQELHVDDINLFKTDGFERANSGSYQNMKPEDWLRCGYVVDMPLSREGSWLRVAVPEREKKNFRLDLVFVPFGSLLVRSMCLLHSGNYGSPGNTRFHATVQVQERNPPVDTSQLGYIRSFQQMESFCDWSVKWNPSIKECYRQASNVHLRCTPESRQLKREGTNSWKRIIRHKSSQLETIVLMLNPVQPRASKQQAWASTD